MSDRLEIVPLTKPPTATVRVPGSKSITNRALVLAALASRNGPCTLTGALRSEDTAVMVECLTKLGFAMEPDWDRGSMIVRQNGETRIIPASSADLFVANSGTTMRFVTAMVSVASGRYRLDGVPRMRQRPIQDLLDALIELGVDARSEAGNGCPPVVVEGIGWQVTPRQQIPGVAYVRSVVSSQFLSGLMMAAPFAAAGVGLLFDENLVSRPYLDLTDAMLHAWGIATAFAGRSRTFHAASQRHAYRPGYAVEPDASAASYFWAAAAITGGRVAVLGLTRSSVQGDVGFVDVLARMGCRVEEGEDGITVHGGALRGIDVDMNDISDTGMTLAAVALFAEGATTIRNVAHIRHKETDRLAALVAELRRVGAEVEEFADGLRITPRPLHGAEIETYNDHRMAMSMALVGLKVPGIIIKNPGCVAKTYPNFFADLERLRDAASPR
jgi:3-phosphoshikimate 1-carboxyvinyltransferase